MKHWIEALAISAIAALAPIQEILIVTFVLVLCDLITGLWAALKLKDRISSAKLRSSVSKFFIYTLAIICGFLVEHYLAADKLPIYKIIAGMVGVVELKSILENLDKINGESLFKKLITQLGSSNLPKDP